MTAEAIGERAYRALLAEVSATPKPGLVDQNNAGAHRDMDYALFCASAAALRPFFVRFAAQGMADFRLPAAGGLSRIRGIGMEAERAMFQATRGVNTHKGAVFSLGLLTAAAGRLSARGEALAPQAVCAAAAAFADGVLSELSSGRASTKGERAYRLYGATGVRGEAAAGFPHVLDPAIPAYRAARASGASENDALCQTLLTLIAAVSDTNVLMREGMDAALWAQDGAKAFLAAHPVPGAPGWREALLTLDRTFIGRNVSPGGCADLLSCMLFLLDSETYETGR